VVLAANFLVLLLKRNLKIILLVKVNVSDFTLVNHVFNHSAIFLHKQFVLVNILDLLENFFQTLSKHAVLCLQSVLSDLIGLRFLCFKSYFSSESICFGLLELLWSLILSFSVFRLF